MRRADASVKRSPERTAKCLVWKESQLVTNFLREERIDVAALLEANPRLRFMLPVRNPIECAVSNVRRGHVRALGGGRGLSRSSPIRDVVAAVLDEIRWFVELREASGRPERFMLFFEHEMGRGVLEQMLRFLALDMDEAFLAAAAEAFTSERAPARNPGLVARYVQLVQERFFDRTEIRDALLRFVPA
jgi:hypothetical protein